MNGVALASILVAGLLASPIDEKSSSSSTINDELRSVELVDDHLAVPGHARPENSIVSTESSTSVFQAMTPCRLLDSREDVAIATGSTRTVEVAGRFGVPESATAVSLTITAVVPDTDGFVTVMPSGVDRTEISTVNVARGEVRANSTVVRLTSGTVDVYVSATMNVLIDVSGWFESASSSSEGRFISSPPTRLVDTRPSRPQPGSSVKVRLPVGVPADAVAVAVTITTTDSAGFGYFTAHTGSIPDASILNTDAAGQTRAAGAIVPVRNGSFQVFTSTGDHVIVDITGWFTGPSARRSSDGMFVPVEPFRLVDTRQTAGVLGGLRMAASERREWPTSSATGPDVSAIVSTVTVVDSDAAGYWLAYPARIRVGESSTVNADRGGQTVANFSMTPVSTAGVAVFASAAAHVLIDITGWFTEGSAMGVQPSPSTPLLPGSHLFTVGDSLTVGAIEEGGYAERLRRAGLEARTDARNGQSLAGGIDILSEEVGAGRLEPLVIVALGTIDMAFGLTPESFRRNVDRLMNLVGPSRSVIWINLHTEDSRTMIFNSILEEREQSYPNLWIADWYSYADWGWLTADGVHYRPEGYQQRAQFMVDQITAAGLGRSTGGVAA